MRPIRLKMEAFGCYVKPITLDFEDNLRGAKIFLIHGNTGAGKTTILDAICFALYGTASGDERKAAMMRSKGIADTVKTEVEFTFALGDKIYTSRHTLTIRGDKIAHSAHLKCDGKTIETKLTDAEKAVTELLGFDVKQFRQVVLLPQGEFDKFLSAKADDRQPILNALFNADFYASVEDGLKLKADAAQKIFNDLQRDKAALETQLQGGKADEPTLAKLRADYDAAQDKAANLRIRNASKQTKRHSLWLMDRQIGYLMSLPIKSSGKRVFIRWNLLFFRSGSSVLFFNLLQCIYSKDISLKLLLLSTFTKMAISNVIVFTI